jgi:hypothetical protein
MRRNDSPQPQDHDRPARIARLIGALVVAGLCFAFGRDVQEAWLHMLLAAIGFLVVVWAVWQTVKKAE